MNPNFHQTISIPRHKEYAVDAGKSFLAALYGLEPWETDFENRE